VRDLVAEDHLGWRPSHGQTGSNPTCLVSRITGYWDRPDFTCPITAFYKGESQEKKHLRRLEGAMLFAALSSPSHVERLWGVRSS
jgi:hypothetical protein